VYIRHGGHHAGHWSTSLVAPMLFMHCNIGSLWPPCVADADIFFMAALRNRGGHYILLWFLSFFPCLISAAADWMSTILWHMVWP